MANYNALREAESVLDTALSLASDIDDEVSAMEAACGQAETSLEEVTQTARETVEHVGNLGKNLREGGNIQAHIASRLNDFDALAREVHGSAFPHILTLPKSATPLVNTSPVDAVPERSSKCDFGSHPAKAHKESSLPSLQHDLKRWDELSKEFTTFEEQLDKAQRLLQEAEAVIDAPRRKEPEKPVVKEPPEKEPEK